MVGLIFILLFGGRDTVTATTYKLTKAENGPYGNHMASGYKVSYKYPGSNRVIAVSPDMLKKYPFHTSVLIEGAGKLDGRWIVEDVMNKRFTKRIDFLIDWKVKHDKFYNVIIKKYDSIKTSIDSSNRSTNHIHIVRTKQNHKTVKHHRRRVKKSKHHSAR
jgi:3D (Asp-Asp-Asp) domain-containing protein